MDKKIKFSLSGLHMKGLGWLFTLCGVAAMVCFPWDSIALPKIILTYLGYISLPIFAWLLVEGFRHTRSLKKYILTMLLFALITEPFYDYACTGVWLSFQGVNGQNILFAFALGLIQLFFLEYMGLGTFGKTLSCIFMVIATGLWTLLLNIPFGFYFELMVGIFYLLEKKKWGKALTSLAAALITGNFSGIIALPLIVCYNGTRGSYSKYIFYAAYPALWAVLALSKLLLKW